MKAVICVGLLVVAFTFGVRSKTSIEQGVEVAGKKVHAVLTVEDQIRAAKVEVKRLDAALEERSQTVASMELELAQLKSEKAELISARAAEKAELTSAIEAEKAEREAAAAAVAFLEAAKADLTSRLEARDAELRELQEVVRKASNELTCVPETPVSVLAVE